MKPPRTSRKLEHYPSTPAVVTQVGACTDHTVMLCLTTEDGDHRYTVNRESCQRLLSGITNCLKAIDSIADN